MALFLGPRAIKSLVCPLALNGREILYEKVLSLFVDRQTRLLSSRLWLLKLLHSVLLGWFLSLMSLGLYYFKGLIGHRVNTFDMFILYKFIFLIIHLN